MYDKADEVELTQQGHGPTPADILEMERQAILNEGDFQEYKVVLDFVMSLSLTLNGY